MRNISLITLFAILLVSCAPVSTTAPVRSATNTPLPTATLTLEPTATPTPEPTATLTPEPTATFAPEPTATPTPIILGELNPYLVGVGEHGAMVCLKPVNESQLEQIALKANISQGGSILDKNIPAENMSPNGTCFEVVDAKYTAGKPVSVEVNATAPAGVTLENKTQTADVGNFQAFPFLRWLFGENGLDNNFGGGFRSGHEAWDLAYSGNSNYPNSVGLPIVAPSQITIFQYENNVEGKGLTHLAGYMSWVGYIFQIGHIDDSMEHGTVGNSYQPGAIIGYIDSTQTGSSRPHTHMYLNTTEIPVGPSPWSGGNIACSTGWIVDPFSNSLGGYHAVELPTGLWLPNTLPKGVIDLFNNGAFRAATSMRYIACPSYNK